MKGIAAWLVLAALASGCATVRHDEKRTPPPPVGRALVVGIGLDSQNRSTVESLARSVARGLDDRWGSVYEARAFANQAARPEAPIPLQQLERAGAGAPLEPGLADWLRQAHGIETLIFVEVQLFDQEWGRETKRTRIKLVAWALDLTRRQVRWRATSAPEVEGESGRSFQVAGEVAVQGLVRAILGEPPPRWPVTFFQWR